MKARHILIALAALGFVWLASSFYVGQRLIRRAAPITAEPVPEANRPESVRLHTKDGLKLGAWFWSGEACRAVVMHGNGASRSHLLAQARIYSNLGCAVLLVTARCHGDSEGETNDIGWSARHDIVAAVDFVEKQPLERRGRAPLIVHGISLGSAASLFAAEELGTRVDGYVLETPFKDLQTAVGNRMDLYLPPVLDTIAFVGLRIASGMLLPYFDRISPFEAAKKVQTSSHVLILAGRQDVRARPAEAEAIYSVLQGPKRLVFFEKGTHTTIRSSDPELYRTSIEKFAEQLQLPRSEIR